MDIYIVLIEDRHCDISMHPFSDKDRAIIEAKKLAKRYCIFTEDYKESIFDVNLGTIFTAKYSCENDCISVIKTVLDIGSL